MYIDLEETEERRVELLRARDNDLANVVAMFTNGNIILKHQTPFLNQLRVT